MGYPNMSYCMNENTLLAMQQILNAMQAEGADFLRELSRDERRAFDNLFNACENFIALSEELQDEVEQDAADPGEMDGDHDSAMASAGFGTDEDYGYAGDEY